MSYLQSHDGSRQRMVSELETSRVPRLERNLRRHLIKCVLTIVALPTIMVVAAPAQGDPGAGSPAADESFLAALSAANMTYSDAGKAIKAGQTMCELVDNGKSGKQIISTLQKHNESLTTEHAVQFMAIAFQAYCPGSLEIGMNGPPPKVIGVS